MTAANRSSRAGRRVGPRYAAVLVAALVLPRVVPAQTRAATGAMTYKVFASPQGSLQLCPGEQLQIHVGVFYLTSRSSPAGRVSVSGSVPHAMIRGRVGNPTIGRLSPNIVYTHGVVGSLGGFYQVVTFTAAKTGQTTIDFLGESQTDPNTGVYVYPPSTGSAAAYQAAPASISVTVSCNFSISLYSVWRLPGERILDVMGVVQSAKLIPAPNTGRFYTPATMSSTAAWMGPCPGASRIQRSQVIISGDVGSQVDIQIYYAPASSTTTEGCIGKSKTDRAQPGTLNVTVPLQGGVLNPQHFLGNIFGRTTVVVKRIP